MNAVKTLVYQVWGWDSMASSYGAEYVEGTYASEEQAVARAKELNDAARAHWMATCSPAGVRNYRDNAHVVAVELK
jgi:hypothetical protein